MPDKAAARPVPSRPWTARTSGMIAHGTSRPGIAAADVDPSRMLKTGHRAKIAPAASREASLPTPAARASFTMPVNPVDTSADSHNRSTSQTGMWSSWPTRKNGAIGSAYPMYWSVRVPNHSSGFHSDHSRVRNSLAAMSTPSLVSAIVRPAAVQPKMSSATRNTAANNDRSGQRSQPRRGQPQPPRGTGPGRFMLTPVDCDHPRRIPGSGQRGHAVKGSAG